MNKQRRKKLQDLIAELRKVESQLDTIIEEEETCMDNFPENLQYSNKFADIENNVDLLQDARSDLTDLIMELEEI